MVTKKRKKKIERATIGPQKRAQIIGAIRRGAESADIAESFGVAEGTVFRIRRQALSAAGVNIKGIRVTPEFAAQALGRRSGRAVTRKAQPARVPVAVDAKPLGGRGLDRAALLEENAALRALLKSLL